MTLFVSIGTEVVTHSMHTVSVSEKCISLPAVTNLPHFPVKPVQSWCANSCSIVHNSDSHTFIGKGQNYSSAL